MKYLITSDIHLSDKSKDKYRFGLFPWLIQQQIKYDIDATLILGDITEEKDKHSSVLVNRLVQEISSLRKPVFILRGNHDGSDPDCPYFHFLNEIEGVNFIKNFEVINFLKSKDTLTFIPHQTSQKALDEICKKVAENSYVFLHNTFDGAIAETGSRLTGLRWPLVACKAYSGDIHRPQKCGPVSYIGAPYHVRFGDSYEPRVLLLDNGKEIDLYFSSPKKLVLNIDDPEEIPKLKLPKGSQVKVIVNLTREEIVEWNAIKAKTLSYLSKCDVEVHGVELKTENTSSVKRITTKVGKTNQERFSTFCKQEKVPSQMKHVGHKLMEGKYGPSSIE